MTAVKKENRGNAKNDEQELCGADARPQALVQPRDQVGEPDIQKARGRKRKDIGGGGLQGLERHETDECARNRSTA